MPASASYTNNQPVHASNATSTRSPANWPTHAPTASRSARKRPRTTSPVSVFSASKVICARCTSNPARIAIRGLLCSSEVPTRESLASSGGGPARKRPGPRGSCHLLDERILVDGLEIRVRGGAVQALHAAWRDAMSVSYKPNGPGPAYPRAVDIEFIAGIAVIAPDLQTSRELFIDALGLPLEA